MSLLWFVFLLIELSLVSWLDFKYRKITNPWSAINIVLWIVSSWFWWGFSWQALLWPAAVLFLGFMLFAVNIAGAGDVKFFSTFTLLLPPSMQGDWLFVLMYSSAAVGLLIIVKNAIKNRRSILQWMWERHTPFFSLLVGGKTILAPVAWMAWVIWGYLLFLHGSLK